MKTAALERLAPLLAVLRRNSSLREVQPTVFHLAGHDFIHFHETPDGVVADVRLVKGQIRMPAATDAEQAELLERIDATLAKLEAHMLKGPRYDADA
jgi:hypothetical protein